MNHECQFEQLLNYNPDKPDPKQRRASHNAVERRRRDAITERIRELAELIPDVFPGDSKRVLHPGEKYHKSVVLRRSVEYIRALRHEIYLRESSEQALRMQVLALQRELDGVHSDNRQKEWIGLN